MTELRVKLPLPMDIAGTLMKIVGLTWPNTVIKDGSGEHGWRSEHQLVFDIPDEDRHKSPKKQAKYEATKQHLSPHDGELTKLGPNNIGVSPVEHLATHWVNMAKQAFEVMDAPNYLEATVRDKTADGFQEYVFYVAKSKDQTPHALRLKAEKERDDLQAQLDERLS